MKDILIPIGLLVVLGSMIFPMYPAVLDFLLIVNLIFALSLLLRALSINDTLRLSALPSMLLLATLFRLSLNVSSTRLILTRGEAGHAIEAFGSIVVQGNVIVGFVIFMVITLIQFIVIAKGSERVAEVSARFTLDALPGKQMSIDADVRAGLIDFQSARQKRQELQTESRFYGALDGAMKFIKGDAIAGMLIIVINVLGGFLIGISIEGLSLQGALHKYTLLSVGDGLLSQIPALLNSLAAGMVVTRVQQGTDESLARELITQLTQTRAVKFVIGIFALVMAFFPGMPAFPFIVLGLVVVGSAFISQDKKKVAVNEPIVFKPKLPALLTLEITPLQGKGINQIVPYLEHFREQAFNDYGLILAPPEIYFFTHQQPQIRVLVRGLKVFELTIDKELPFDAALKLLKEKLLVLVSDRISEFVDDSLTRRILDFYEKQLSELIASVVPQVVSVTQLTAILRGLCEERVSIKNFDTILQALAETAGRTGDNAFLLEQVRKALRRVIVSSLQNEKGELSGLTLDPLLELGLVQSDKAAQQLTLSSIDQLCKALAAEKQKHSHTVLVVAQSIRRMMREIVTVRGVTVPVIGYDELISEIPFCSRGMIQLHGEEGYALPG